MARSRSPRCVSCPSPTAPTSSTGSHSAHASKRSRARCSREIQSRLGFLLDVGLEYLSLSRAAATLSGGEAQTHPASHPDRLRPGRRACTCSTSRRSACTSGTTVGSSKTLTRLRDLGNTLIVVEHDEGHHRARRLDRRHRPGSRRARWPHRAQRNLPGTIGQQGLDHRRLPVGQESIAAPAIRRPGGQAASAHRCRRTTSTTCARSTCPFRSVC